MTIDNVRFAIFIGILCCLLFLLLAALFLPKHHWEYDATPRHIKKYIEQLASSLGRVCAPVNDGILRELYVRNDFASMLGWIKNSLHLDLKVGLRIVDAGGQTAPMWIELPRPMPMYGTSEFKRTRVIVNARRDIIYGKPFEWVVAGFAHELSHVVLFSIGHPFQHDEKAVDLTAMILGYREFISNTDRTEIHGGAAAIGLSLILLPLGFLFIPGRTKSSLGYLTKAEKRHAYNYLRKIDQQST